MIVYVDSSVVLRIVLGQSGGLAEWKSITRGVASGLLEVECLRTIDRLRLMGQLSIDVSAVRRETVFRILESLELVDPTSAILRRAAQPMPTPLGTLDAIHLATAEMWQEASGQNLIVATHDRELALGARASGFRVIGA